jgi:hypothetical protein
MVEFKKPDLKMVDLKKVDFRKMAKQSLGGMMG